MFGFSTGEIFGTTLFALVVLGPKDVPVLARTVGRLCGRAVAYAGFYRKAFERVVIEDGAVRQLHDDITSTTRQLDRIGREIREVSSSPVRRELRRRDNGFFKTDEGNGSSSSSAKVRSRRKDDEPRVFEGISVTALRRSSNGNEERKREEKENDASTILREALAEEEVAREVLRLSKCGGAVDAYLSKSRKGEK